MEQYERKLKCELYNDHMQNFKSYGIPKAQLIIGDMPYCYDEETECWTALGWKKYTELNYDDTVLSLNPATMEIEYSGIENIIVRDNTERMVRFETMHMNLLVTENHRMFVRHRYKSHSAGIRKRKFTSTDGIRLAKDVNGGWYIPRSGYTWKSASEQREIIIPSCELNTNGRESIADELHIPLDKWLPFFGLWLADGCTCNSKARNGRQLYTVSIKQAGEKRKIVREMLKDFPLKSIEYAEKNNDKSNFNIFSKQLWIYLHQFGKSKEKFVPRWILDLPTDYLRLLWKWYTFGDSHRNGDGLTISSVSEQLMLDMQEVALKLGTICQMRTENYEYHSSPMWCFHFNPNSKDITYGSKQYVDGYKGKVWCITCKTNSVFLVRRRGLIAWCGNCVGDDAYGSSPSWYLQGDNKCGESELAHSSFFDTDDYFRIPEFMDFCTRMLRPDPKMGGVKRGRPAGAPCMILFCAFEQIPTVISYAEKYGFKHNIPLLFIKNYSPQVLKANMRVVGATEYAMLFYRDKLPKFNNDGKMVFNWFPWERDGNDVPSIHPTQKPVKVLKRLIELFTDPYDVVIDPCAGSGSTLRAAVELGRNAYGFEIKKDFYKKAKEEMLNISAPKYGLHEIDTDGSEQITMGL